MNKQKLFKWIEENKGVIKITLLGISAAAGTYLAYKYATRSTKCGGNTAFFDFADTSINIVDLYPDDCKVIGAEDPIGHMVIDADYDITRGFMTDFVRINCDKLTSGRYVWQS